MTTADRLRVSLEQHQRVSTLLSAVGAGAVVAGVVLWLVASSGWELSLVGAMLALVAVPSFYRASTLRRQLRQVEQLQAMQLRARYPRVELALQSFAAAAPRPAPQRFEPGRAPRPAA